MELLTKNITATSADFFLDEETEHTKARDGLNYIVGGMIADKTVKLTKNNQNMAFLTLEDLYGTLEVIVFPRHYERYRSYLEEDRKIFIRGRASVSEEEGKLICEQIIPFDEVPRELWLQFESIEAFQEGFPSFEKLLLESHGNAPVIIYCKKENARKRLGERHAVLVTEPLVKELQSKIGEKNVKVVEKSIEKTLKKY